MDVIMFMGQSNIAGRGDSKEELPLFMGADFRAVSDPERLYPIADPFGVHENRTGGIDDGAKKTGSLVPAYVRRYYEEIVTMHDVVGKKIDVIGHFDLITKYNEKKKTRTCSNN